jgi:predicted RNA-binding protein YlxR (DUF448 family)
VIYCRRNNAYYGSSSWPEYNKIVDEDDISVKILKSNDDDYTAILNYESVIQQQLDVVASPLYFNKSIATVNTYTDPSYATYKHVETGKCVRLPRSHPLVELGVYVGVTKGSVIPEEIRKKIGRSGFKNPFFNKTHTKEAREKISKANKGRIKTQEQIDKWIEKVAKKPKSAEHRKKIGRKGLIMLQNVNTKESIRIPKEEAAKLDNKIWVNPTKINPGKKVKCKYCGKESNVGNIKRWHDENCKFKM